MYKLVKIYTFNYGNNLVYFILRKNKNKEYFYFLIKLIIKRNNLKLEI